MVEESSSGNSAVKMARGAAGQRKKPYESAASDSISSNEIANLKNLQKEAANEDDNYRYYLEFCRLKYSRQVLLHQLNIALQEQASVQTRLHKI